MKRKKLILKVISVSQIKNKFAETLRRISKGEEVQIVERAGLPMVAMVSLSDLERLYPEEIKALLEMARAKQNLDTLLGKTQPRNAQFSDDEVMADALKAQREVRRTKHKRK